MDLGTLPSSTGRHGNLRLPGARLFACLPLSGVVLALLLSVAQSFEVFSEQQILKLKPDAKVGEADYNNSELGSTYIDDYWAKIDVNYSPLEGWSLIKYVKIGCFDVRFVSASSSSYATKNLATVDKAEEDCTLFCNGTQAYIQFPLCRCALNETDIGLRELKECLPSMWEIYRHFDYRSSMQPTAYDVARRFLYQLVSIRMMHVDPPVRDYIHAINVFENKPAFKYDTRLDRTVFNAVWDFRKSRLVALSWYPDDDPQLYFSTVSFNTSNRTLVTVQQHTLIQDQIAASGSLLAKFTSVDGMGTVDILFGTYYSSVPAQLPETPVVVDIIFAIDVDRKKVLNSATLPVTLMNMQINCLTHVLYGSGLDLTGRLAYFELCTAENVTKKVDSVTQTTAVVECEVRELGELPSQVNQMYLQSASIDHHYNYAWFAYKEVSTGPPLILEYHQNDAQYIRWREDSLPLEAVFSSLIQTAPRIIFALYAPNLEYVKFNAAGTKIFLQFTAPTLQGAIPQDSDGDEIPDYWNEADKKIREPCEMFLDDFTMQMMKGAMCQWVSDARMFIEITMGATIMPGDLVRLRANRIYAGRISPSGVAQFSQPSTDFKPVQLPDSWLPPTADISGFRFIDKCTSLTLDGEGSQNYGFRGHFRWSLNRTEPPASEPEVNQIMQLLRDQRFNDPYKNPHSIRIPTSQLQENYMYYFDLNVTTLWDPSMSALKTHGVLVSPLPVPPISILGSTKRLQNPAKDMYISAEMENSPCMNTLSGFDDPIFKYTWTGCLGNQTKLLFAGIEGCDAWYAPLLEGGKVSGIRGRNLRVGALTMDVNARYVFTVKGELTSSDGSNVTLSNIAVVIIDTTIGRLDLITFAGDGFSAPIRRPLVLDMVQVEQGCYGPTAAEGAESIAMCADDGVAYNFSCTIVATGLPCDLGCPGEVPADPGLGLSPSPTPTDDPGLGLTPSPSPTPSPGAVSGSRRLSAGCPVVLANVPCSPVYNKDSGEKETFYYRGKYYNEAMNITVGTPSPYEKYCFQQQGLLIIQPNFFEVGKVEFVVNMSKNFAGTIRTTAMTVVVDIIEESTGGDGRYPLIKLQMKSPYPVNPSVVNRFIGAVTNEVNGTVYEYSWQAFQWTANPDYDPDQATTNPNYTVARYSYVEMQPPVIDFASQKQFRTAPGSKYLVINAWTLSPAMQYRLRMNVVDTVARAAGMTAFESYSEITFTTVGLPPSGGILRVANSTGIGFVTKFALELTGWGTEDLPLTYGFGYRRDPSDPYEITSYLSTIFTERSYIDTILPMGALAPDYILNVYGYVKSASGVLAESNPVAVMVRPPEDPTVMLKLIQRVPNLDPEGGLLLAKMIVQVQEVSNPPSPVLNMTLQAIVSTVRSLDLAKTEGLVFDFSNFLEVVAVKGLRSQQVLDNMAWCINKSVEWRGLLSLDRALTPNDVNLAIALLSATDVLMPGVVTEVAASGARRLQVIDPSESRTPDEQWDQLMQLKEQQRLIGSAMLAGLFPGEVPYNMSVRGCDFFLGKEYTLENRDLAVLGNVTKTFKVPSLDFIQSTYGREVFSFRYQIFKKFPYSFWDVPERHSLTAPAEDAGTGGLRIPRQGYGSSAGRLWYAMTLDIGSEAGDPIPAEIKASLVNSTFDRLIKIDASGAQTRGQYTTVDYAATCYAVGLDGSLPRFDSRGVTFDQESCISTQLRNFVVLIDDLPKEIESFESFSRGKSLDISEDRPATAAVGTLLICILCGVAAGAFGIYVDEKEHDKTPIDLSKKRVVDGPDPLEKLIQTLLLTFRRNHLVVGMLVKHRKLTREKRVWIMMVAGLSTQSVATVLHANSLIKFRATSQFLATGLTAGVLVFPLTVFLQFLYEWRPMTRMHSYAPPRSVPAPTLERKDAQKQLEMAQVKSLHQPKRPPIPMKVRPPPRSAAPRVPLMSQLSLPVMAPGLPLDLPKLKTGNGKIAPPPRLQPQKPRPPKEPPPEEHLMMTRPPASTFGDSIASRSFGLSGSLGSSTGSPGPFGLTLPELPPLLQGASSAVTGKAMPAPPPKKSGAGPRPPQAPPPVSKMFFALPAGSVLRQHGLPAPPPKPPAFGLPKGPSLPPLPRMMPPHDTLSAVRLSADPELPSGRTLPPPPPRLSLNGHGFGAAPPPPETPREDTLMMTRPGTLDQTPRGPPSFRGAPEDVEFTSGLPHARFVMDPEHAMMPPGSVPSQTPQPPPPPKRMPPNGSAKAPGIPALPSAASSSLALAPLPELPGGVTSPPPPRPPPGGHLAVSTSPSGAQWGQLAVPEVVDSRMELVLAPLRHLPGHGRIPALPGNLPPPVALPNSVLAKVPAIQRESGLLPPPPPPPVGGFGRLALMPLPPEDGEPTVVQKLTVWKAPPRRGGPTSTPPRPPPKMPSAPLRPKPPIGPPPAHAIVLARKAGAPGFHADAIVSAARPPPVGKAAPPSGPPPQNQRRDAFALISKQDVDEIAKNRIDIAKNPNKDMTIDGLDPFALGRTDPRLFVGAAKKRHDEKAPKPVPDYIVQYSLGAVQLFVVFNILVFTGIITLYGTYLPPSAVYPTYAATIVGVVINLGLFESVKCVVICCLSMVHDESEKRDLELRARRARMEMKAQRFHQRGRRFVVNEKHPGH